MPSNNPLDSPPLLPSLFQVMNVLVNLILCAWVSCCIVSLVHHMYAWHTQRPEEGGHQISWNWVRDTCRPPCVCWESNPRPLEEQPILLTTEPPSLQHPLFLILRQGLMYFSLASNFMWCWSSSLESPAYPASTPPMELPPQPYCPLSPQ